LLRADLEQQGAQSLAPYKQDILRKHTDGLCSIN